MVNVDNRGTRGPRGSNNTLYFIVGALVIAVLIIGYFMYGRDDVDTVDGVVTEEGATPDVDVDVTAPADTTPEPATPPAGGTEPATPPAGGTEPTTPPAGGTEPTTPPAGGTAPAPQ